MTIIFDGYWSEVTMLVTGPPAHFPPGPYELSLAGYRASSPRTSVRWLRDWAVRISDGLDPPPDTGPVPAACLRPATGAAHHPADTLRAWATDLWTQGHHMDALASGEHISITTGGPDHIIGLCDVDVFYTLSARPIATEFMAEWNLPPHHHQLATA